MATVISTDDEFEGRYATHEKQFFAIFSKTIRNFSI